MENQNAVTAQQEKAEQLEKIQSMNRREKRSMLRDRPNARVRSGAATGSTPHFKAWMADLSAKSALQRLKTADLAESTSGDLASAWALLSVGGLKSVWDVSQTHLGRLMVVNGIGLKRLEKVEEYLKARRVPLKWTTA